MRVILLNMVLGSVSFGYVRCLRYMLARRVCRRQAPPEASGGNLWKGTQTCFGGGVHTSQRRVSGFREGERASEGRGCTWRCTLNARQKGKPEGSLPVQLISHGTRLQKADPNNECRPQHPEEERKGTDRTEALPHGPISRLCHGSPDLGS